MALRWPSEKQKVSSIVLILMSMCFKIFQGCVSPLLYWEEMRGFLRPPSNPEPEVNVTPIPAMPETAEIIYKPKLCRMEKTPAGFGFHLNGIQGVYGQYIKEVKRTQKTDYL